MKVIKLLLFIVLLFNFSNIYAKKDIAYTKENNGIIQIGTKNARFGQIFKSIWFDYYMSLELYTNKIEKQYALKLSIPLKVFAAFQTNTEVIIKYWDNNKQSLHIDSTYTYTDTEFSHIIIPVTQHDIENIISCISSIQFDVLFYDKWDELGIEEYTTVQEFDKKGWDGNNYNFRKKLKSYYDDVNKEFERLKASGFVINN